MSHIRTPAPEEVEVRLVPAAPSKPAPSWTGIGQVVAVMATGGGITVAVLAAFHLLHLPI